MENSTRIKPQFYNLSRTEDILSNINSSTEIEEEWNWFWGEEAPFIFPYSFQVAAHILYNVVMVLGLIGNGCVLLVFSQKKRPFRKLPTPLLGNLAVGDLLITIFCLETSYLSLLWQYWPFGKLFCFSLSPIKPIAVFVSCYTLIALSVDRYLGVKNPLHTGVLSKENVRWTIVTIWILAICTSLPVAFYTSYEIHLLTGLPRCGEYAWESETMEMIYDLALITLQFFIPLVVLVYTYTRISIVVCKNRALRHRMSHGTSPRQKSLRTIRMSLMVVLGYTLWLPYNIVHLLAKYNRALGESDHFPFIFVTCHFFAMSHALLNPIIYFWLNDAFRNTVMEMFCRKKAIERRRTSSTLFSWRTSNAYMSNGRSSSIKGNSGRLKQLRSASESTSFPGSPLFTVPNKLENATLGPDEETMIIIKNGEND